MDRWNIVTALLLGAAIGMSGARWVHHQTVAQADQQARQQYADQLNACYNPDSGDQSATDLYNCVANWDAR